MFIYTVHVCNEGKQASWNHGKNWVTGQHIFNAAVHINCIRVRSSSYIKKKTKKKKQTCSDLLSSSWPRILLSWKIQLELHLFVINSGNSDPQKKYMKNKCDFSHVKILVHM